LLVLLGDPFAAPACVSTIVVATRPVVAVVVLDEEGNEEALD
jgi:hypothetical protein